MSLNINTGIENLEQDSMAVKYRTEIVDKEIAYKGFFKLEKYRLRHSLFQGGMSNTMSRELFERGHAVAVLPYDPQRDEVVLLEQFRIGALNGVNGAWLTEIIAGMIDKDETAEQVARREAVEEAGCEIKELIPICNYYVSPGGTSETIELYCGIVDTEQVQEGIYGLEEENEDIRVFKTSYQQLIGWLEQGKINSAAPVIAVQWLMLNRETLRRERKG